MNFPDIPSGLYVLLALVIILIVASNYLKTIAERLIIPSYRETPLFSEAEKRFFRALNDAVRNEKVKVLAKVRLADIFSVERRDRKFNWRDFAKISQKHVDFLLVDAVTLEALMGIELDDSSHLSIKGRERDGVVNGVFKGAGLPLHHIRASGRYDAQAIRQTLFGTAQYIPAAKNTGVTESGR